MPDALPYPAAVSADKRHLLDQNGAPFLLVGDSPQCLSGNRSPAEMETYFADRQARGFNAAWVMLICGPYTKGRKDGRTRDGIAPFLKTGDLSTPNPAYFARMDDMVRMAGEHGITLFLQPAETGSWRDLLLDNGVEATREYGRFVGARYREARNIVWFLGNDYQIDQWERYDDVEIALAQGLRDTDPGKLQIVELNPNVSTSYDNPRWPGLMDLATSYSYMPTYDANYRAYDGTPRQPVIMIEANYEGENNDHGPKTTDVTMRRQEWWSALSGTAGQFYGHGKTWGFTDDKWLRYMDTPAVVQLGVMRDFLLARPWFRLVPDREHRFATAGLGTYGSEGDVLENDYATAATTPDGTLGVVYVPTGRTIDVDLSVLAPGVTARWLDPSDGAMRPAAAPFTTPGRNGAGDEDWVLVVEAAG